MSLLYFFRRVQGRASALISAIWAGKHSMDFVSTGRENWCIPVGLDRCWRPFPAPEPVVEPVLSVPDNFPQPYDLGLWMSQKGWLGLANWYWFLLCGPVIYMLLCWIILKTYQCLTPDMMRRIARLEDKIPGLEADKIAHQNLRLRFANYQRLARAIIGKQRRIRFDLTAFFRFRIAVLQSQHKATQRHLVASTGESSAKTATILELEQRLLALEEERYHAIGNVDKQKAERAVGKSKADRVIDRLTQQANTVAREKQQLEEQQTQSIEDANSPFHDSHRENLQRQIDAFKRKEDEWKRDVRERKRVHEAEISANIEALTVMTESRDTEVRRREGALIARDRASASIPGKDAEIARCKQEITRLKAEHKASDTEAQKVAKTLRAVINRLEKEATQQEAAYNDLESKFTSKYGADSSTTTTVWKAFEQRDAERKRADGLQGQLGTSEQTAHRLQQALEASQLEFDAKAEAIEQRFHDVQHDSEVKDARVRDTEQLVKRLETRIAELEVNAAELTDTKERLVDTEIMLTKARSEISDYHLDDVKVLKQIQTDRIDEDGKEITSKSADTNEVPSEEPKTPIRTHPDESGPAMLTEAGPQKDEDVPLPQARLAKSIDDHDVPHDPASDNTVPSVSAKPTPQSKKNAFRACGFCLIGDEASGARTHEEATCRGKQAYERARAMAPQLYGMISSANEVKKDYGDELELVPCVRCGRKGRWVAASKHKEQDCQLSKRGSWWTRRYGGTSNDSQSPAEPSVTPGSQPRPFGTQQGVPPTGLSPASQPINSPSARPGAIPRGGRGNNGPRGGFGVRGRSSGGRGGSTHDDGVLGDRPFPRGRGRGW